MTSQAQSNNTLGWPEHVTVPEGLTIKFVGMDNPYMQKAFLHAYENKFADMTTNGSAIIIDGRVVGIGINGDGFHQREKKCLRAGGAVGQDYESCPGCHPDNHSERTALRQAQKNGADLRNAELYMYGHWWSCEPCMTAARDAGITTLYVLADSRPLFDRAVEGQKQNRQKFEEEWHKKLT